MVDIRLPNITGTPDTQLAQIKRYLFSLSEQLNYALTDMDKRQETVKQEIVKVGESSMANKSDPQQTFNSIKDLIIKSADIVNAYYEQIDLVLRGEYVAQSDFGTYQQEVTNEIKASADGIRQDFYSKEQIDGLVQENRGYIKTGIVGSSIGGEDSEAIGVEIGDFRDGGSQSRFARYTSKGIELFDGANDKYPVATISSNKITITSAEFITGAKLGKYKVDFTNGIAFMWEG